MQVHAIPHLILTVMPPGIEGTLFARFSIFDTKRSRRDISRG
jgi:hypothetical protein